MASTESTNGGISSASRQGELWGARARDWAELQEPTARALYNAILSKLDVGVGTTLLDIGCGSGLFCKLAADRGAAVSGVDAATPLIAIAKERTPEGDFRVCDMENLPYPDDTFDLVTGTNAFQWADNPVNALREARRVARPGAPVVIATWGKREDSEASVYLAALQPLLPPSESGTLRPLRFSEMGAVQEAVAEAGLTPREGEDVECPFIYPELDTALRGLLSAGMATWAIETSGEEPVREAVVKALAPFKNVFGGYRMENKWRYLVTTA